MLYFIIIWITTYQYPFIQIWISVYSYIFSAKIICFTFSMNLFIRLFIVYVCERLTCVLCIHTYGRRRRSGGRLCCSPLTPLRRSLLMNLQVDCIPLSFLPCTRVPGTQSQVLRLVQQTLLPTIIPSATSPAFCRNSSHFILFCKVAALASYTLNVCILAISLSFIFEGFFSDF